MANTKTLCLNCMTDKGDKAICAQCGDHGEKQNNAIALPCKTVLNKRFLVGRVLGRPGGFGITYLAWDMLLETTAAIKEFLPLSSVNREPGKNSVQANSREDQELFNMGLRIFLKEAKTLAQFSHPNIVRIRDFFSANNTAYLVMEYHQGQPLDQVIAAEGGRLTEDRALEIMLPLMDGLEAVHQKGFLHRDIKPQNIYVTDKGVPVLLDFGASRFAVADCTKTLTVMLSAGYAPFEQYHQKGKQGPWTDVYSCAATLYSMVTGKMPDNAIDRQHDDKLLSPIKLNPHLSESFSLGLMEALKVDIRSRPQNISALKQILFGSSFHPTVMPRTGNVSQAMHLPQSAPKPERQPVVIQYDNSKSGSGLGRVLLYAGLAAVLWFSWSTRQMIKINSSSESSQIQIVMPQSDTEMVLPEEFTDVEYVEIIEPLEKGFSVDEFDIEPVLVMPAQSEIPLVPERMVKPAIPEIAFTACENKRPHSRCRIEPIAGRVQGVCLPVESGKLACFPEPPPFHKPPPPPSGLHFRR